MNFFSAVSFTLFFAFTGIVTAQRSPGSPEAIGSSSLTPAEKDILKWSYKGKLAVGMSTRDFISRYPSADINKDNSNFKIKDIHYGVTPSVANDVEYIIVKTFEDKVYEIQIFYSVGFVERLGGYRNFTKKLVARYGLADADSKGNDVKEPGIYSLFWRFPKVSRYIGCDVFQETLRLTVTDMRATSKLGSAKRESVDLGF